MHATRRPRSLTRTRDGVTRLLLAAAAMTVAVPTLIGCSTAGTDDSAATGDRVFVQGYSEGCEWIEEEKVEDDDPDTTVWKGVLRCPDEMSDPRVTGVDDWTLVDPYYVDYTSFPRSGRFEASVVLTPDEGEGTWRGEGFGADLWAGSALHTVFHAELAGEGAYDGLVYRVWGSQQPETGRYEIVGYIEPAE